MRVRSLLAAMGCAQNPLPDPVDPEVDETVPSYRLHAIESLVYVSWDQRGSGTVHVEYSFDEGLWRSSPSRFAAAGAHEQLLVGIPYDTAAQWRTIEESTGEVLGGGTLVTGPQPPGLPRPDLVASDPERQQPGAEWLLTSLNAEGGWEAGTFWTVILDRQGRTIWATKTPSSAWTLFATLSVTGDHLLWDEQTRWRDIGSAGEDSKVHATWLDREMAVMDTPGLHHAFVELPDQSLVWGSQAHGGGEALVQRSPGQQGETVLWTCESDWPVAGYWCESNGLYYEASTDSFLYSFYSNNTIVEVSHQTGRSLWWAGEAEGGYTFAPAASQFGWQHGLSYTDVGTLLLSSVHGEPEETWLLEYEVDRDAGVLSLVWSNSAGVHAETNGQAWRLPNGNTLHLVGSAGVIREVTGGGDDVWRLDYHDDHLLGRGQFLSDLYALIAPDTTE